jgi:hypothetical protein
MDRQPDRRVVLVLSAVLLTLALLLYKLGGYLTDSPARFLDLNWLALADAGFLPYRDFWVERAPAMAGWSLVAYRASLLLPPWLDWRLFFALFDGLAGLAGGLVSLVVASRLLSPLRLALFGASLGLVALTVAGDGAVLLALTLIWLALGQAGRWRAATLVAAFSPFVIGPLLLLVHLGWGVVVRRRLEMALALVPAVVAFGVAALAGGNLAGSARAVLATGGAPLFTATERRLDPALVPAPALDCLVPLALALLAALIASRRGGSLAEGTALTVAAAGLVGPWASPATLVVLGAFALLTQRLVVAALLSAGLSVVGASWLATAVGETMLAQTVAAAIGAVAVALMVSRRVAGLDDEGGGAAQLIAFVTLRLGALVLLRPFGYFGEWNDFNFFLGWARLADEGLFPFRDFWMEHPPVFPALIVLAYQVAGLLPSVPEDRLWFNLVLGLLTFPGELAALIATRRLARLAAAPAGVATASWSYVLSFPALFFWTAGFDGLVLAFTLLGLAAALAGGWVRGGVWIGLGALTKLVPATTLPALVVAAGRRGGVRLIGAFAVVLAVVLLPVIALNPRLAAASAASLTTRGSWETVWALADGYYRGGELVPPRERVDPASVAATARPSVVPWLPFALVGALGYLVLLRRARQPLGPRRTLAWATLGLIGFLTISKGWSPQFVVYPLGLVFLVLPARRALAYAVTLVGANTFEYPIALLLLDGEPLPLAVAVIWRTLALGLLTLDLLAIALPLRPRPRLAAITAGVCAAAPLALLPLLVWALLQYRALWFEPSDPTWALLAEATRRGGILVTTDDEYRRLAPYATGSILRPVGGTLSLSALGERAAWLVPAADPAELEQRAVALAPFGVIVERLVQPPAAVFVAIDRPWVRLETPLDGHLLRAYSVVRLEPRAPSMPGGLVVSTAWELNEGGPTDLRLFAHLVAEDGRLLTQNDGPVRKSDGAPTERIDRRVLPLAPGGARVLVGLYDGETGRRLLAPDGRDAVVLSLP